MRKRICVAVAVPILCLCFVTKASAGSISGAYAYGMTGQTGDAACAILYGGNPWTDNFQSTSGGNSIASDPVTFSICDGTPGFLDGGQFLVSDGTGDTLAGTFSGVLTGTSAGGGDIFEGAISIVSETGHYTSVTESTGTFEVVTGQVGTPAFPTGTIDFQAVPEPVTATLAGSGLLLLSLSRKFLKPRRG